MYADHAGLPRGACLNLQSIQLVIKIFFVDCLVFKKKKKKRLWRILNLKYSFNFQSINKDMAGVEKSK